MTDAIRRSLVKIQEEVDFDEIETFLFQEGAINVEEREMLETEPGNTRKVRLYIQISTDPFHIRQTQMPRNAVQSAEVFLGAKCKFHNRFVLIQCIHAYHCFDIAYRNSSKSTRPST